MAFRNSAPISAVRLPWAMELDVDPDDTITNALVGQGIYDIVTTEVLWRLTMPGDRTIDVGANVGYMTSILTLRAGPDGDVTAIEPHPKTLLTLRRNVERWNLDQRCAPISLCEGVLSDHDGTVMFLPYTAGDRNASHGYVSEDPGKGVETRSWTLDTFLDGGQTVGVAKVDTEWHEARIFSAARKTLASGSIRDIVYEEVTGYPAASHAYLEAAGYVVFAFEERLSGPKLLAPGAARKLRADEIPPSYLATREPERARTIFERKGWACLSW